jgi:acyl-CoA dehydrogenase
MWAFMVGEIFPAEKAWNEYLQEHGAHAYPPVMELKESARRRGSAELGLSRRETTGRHATRDERA